MSKMLGYVTFVNKWVVNPIKSLYKNHPKLYSLAYFLPNILATILVLLGMAITNLRRSLTIFSSNELLPLGLVVALIGIAVFMFLGVPVMLRLPSHRQIRQKMEEIEKIVRLNEPYKEMIVAEAKNSLKAGDLERFLRIHGVLENISSTKNRIYQMEMQLKKLPSDIELDRMNLEDLNNQVQEICFG